jgi:hypothetical protein
VQQTGTVDHTPARGGQAGARAVGDGHRAGS